MNRQKLEIERKFLLKKLPDFPEVSEENFPKIVEQCYVWDESLKNHIRYRGERSQDGTETFYTTIKTPVSGITNNVIINDEQEELIEKNEFVKQFRASEKRIGKIRYYLPHNGLLWEIDKFMNLDLVVAEVELDSEDQEFEIPKEIQDVLIMEVSQFDEFKNYSLAGTQ